MIKKVWEKTKGWQIHKQLIVLILLTGMVSVLLFEVLWLNKWNIYEYVRQIPGLHDVSLDEDFWEDLRAEATKYDIPSSEDDKAGIKKIQPFLEQGDKYTGIYIYALKEGNYITGRFPKVLENAAFSTFFDMGYQLTGGEGEETYEFPMKFKNGYATVMVWFYHRVRFIYPYCIFSLTVSIGLFFTVILFFIKKKMNLVAELKDEILRMAAGNLRDSIPNMGQDEIGIIAEELDNLRAALQDTLVREKESRRANQDLITAMSHDLRTPLTILNGYLEVLRLNRNPEMHEEYLKRCLQKTSDIREMTDRMFEYALVFEEGEEPKVKEIPIKFFRDCINEHSDFIRLAGFQTEMEYTYVERWITGDKGMIKRILSNLFSNKKETLYLKRDSHWNEKGSLLAYNALLTDLNKEHELYETVPVLRTKTEIGDLNKMIYPMWSQPEWNYDYQYKKNYTYTSDTKSVEDAYITTTNKKAQGSLLMFRDSFGNTLLPWMAQSYEKVVFSKEMPYPLEKYMQESKADTVIIEKVERNLKDFITDPPMLTPSETKLSGEAKQVETKTTVHVGVSEADTAYTEVYGKLDSKYVTPGMKVYIAVGEDSDQHIYQAYLVNAASSDDSLDTTTTQYRLYLPQETVDTKTKVQVYVESEQGLYLVGQSLKGE